MMSKGLKMLLFSKLNDDPPFNYSRVALDLASGDLDSRMLCEISRSKQGKRYSEPLSRWSRSRDRPFTQSAYSLHLLSWLWTSSLTSDHSYIPRLIAGENALARRNIDVVFRAIKISIATFCNLRFQKFQANHSPNY